MAMCGKLKRARKWNMSVHDWMCAYVCVARSCNKNRNRLEKKIGATQTGVDQINQSTLFYARGASKKNGLEKNIFPYHFTSWSVRHRN